MLNTEDAALFSDLGELYFSHDHYDIALAKRFYERSVSINPTKLHNHYQLGRIYFLEGNFPRALSEIEAEQQLNPSFGKTHYMKGLILGYMGNYESSAAAFGKFIESDPINWAGYNDLSWVYFSSGDFASAKLTAEIGLGYAARNPWLLNSLGVAELGLEDKTRARAAFSQALESLAALGPSDWGRAYPGNDPRIYDEGFDSMKESIVTNLAKTL
jgi:tetratricopeptide (TPR) repeat protein